MSVALSPQITLGSSPTKGLHSPSQRSAQRGLPRYFPGSERVALARRPRGLHEGSCRVSRPVFSFWR